MIVNWDRHYWSCWIAASLAAVWATPAWAWQEEPLAEAPATAANTAPAASSTRFVRLKRDEFGDPLALETATAKYVLRDEQGEVKQEVYLEAVVHIAESSYFRSLNKRFQHYDSVLYELVARPEDNRPAKKEEGSEDEGDHLLRMIQKVSADTLGLVHQLDEIDYQARNLVHSDLSPEEMSERMKSRGDSANSMVSDLLMHLLNRSQEALRQAENEATSEAKPLAGDGAAAKPEPQLSMSVLTDPNGVMQVRRVFAHALADSTELEKILPQSVQLLLIEDRNDEAMKVLRQRLDAGDRRIALFWGAGHMADFEQRLTSELGMSLESVSWRSAWDLRDGAVEGSLMERVLETALKDTLKDSFKDKLKRLLDSTEKE